MFTTFVMACSMMTGQCIIVEDAYGPYSKEVHCVERAAVIVTDVAEALGTPHSFSFKCKEEKGI
jgi:hypothetical protein